MKKGGTVITTSLIGIPAEEREGGGGDGHVNRKSKKN